MNLLRQRIPYQRDSAELYQRLRHLGDGFLLESGDRHPGHHVDVLSVAPVHQHRLNPGANTEQLQSTLQAIQYQLQTLMALWMTAPSTRSSSPLFRSPLPGWYGLWSYEAGGLTESVTLSAPSLDLPWLWMGFFPSIIVTNHLNKTCYLIGLSGFEAHFQSLLQALPESESNSSTTQKRDTNTSLSTFRLTSPFTSNLDQTEYTARFDRIQQYIHQGDCYQINLAQRFSTHYEGSPWLAYRRLQRHTQSPMGGFFEAENWSVLSTSPERFIQVQNRQVTTQPIKGTRPRHADPKQDQQLAQILANSAKDRAENLMIVDLLRNDLGRSCITGSVSVPKLFNVESFSNVHHLVSTITGELKDDAHPLELIYNAFPGGSITGAPKHRAMEIIDELEPHGRSFYCGIALYCDIAGNLDSNILIRTLVTHHNQIHCWGGGGIVADSVCEQEYRETLDKVGHLLTLLSD